MGRGINFSHRGESTISLSVADQKFEFYLENFWTFFIKTNLTFAHFCSL